MARDFAAAPAAAASAPAAAAAAAPPPSQLSRVLDGSRMFLAGGAAGACARTATAPLDRIKLLFQVQAVPSSGAAAGAYTSVGQAAAKILREEGAAAFWKGNGANIVRIFPYSAAQLAANDQYKRRLAAPDGAPLSVPRRLAAGAAAGMTATALTHPLDTVRLRLALPNSGYRGMGHAVATMVRAEGVASLYKGLAPTLAGIAPYAALNFATYDLLKKHAYGEGGGAGGGGADGGKPRQRVATNLLLGGAAGTAAATVCYPLDTIRRRMQMAGRTYAGQADAFRTIWAGEGLAGFYRGYAANTIKVVPQNAIRFVAYEGLKALLGVRAARTDT